MTVSSTLHTLAEVLTAHARDQPNAPLLIAPEAKRKLTYGDLARQTEQLARFLQGRGHQPGAKVGLFLHNGYQTTTLFLASMCAGYVVTPFNLLAQRGGLAAVVRHSEVGIVFSSAAQVATLTEALADVADAPEVVVIDVDAADVLDMAPVVASVPPLKAKHSAKPSDPALLMYTSGTTGTPKGVLLSHANLLAAANTVAAWHGLTPQDRVLSSLPLYHINGQVIATLSPFVSGGSIVNPHRFSVSQWWDHRVLAECSRNRGAKIPVCAVRPIRFRAAAAGASQGVRGAVRHPRHRGDGHDRVRINGVLQSASRSPQVRQPRSAVRRRGGRDQSARPVFARQ
jgi:acyl-CoA synthetase (AMP-forming)/AMP-acid ligase II